MTNSVIRASVLIIILLFAAAAAAQKVQASEDGLWDALRREGHFALMRHALAPGTGDPSNFTIGRRETQRNLSAAGRQQAREIGAMFRNNKIDRARVYSSQWFRCMDTAELLDLGNVTALPALNSFFRDYSKKNAQTQALTDWLFEQKLTEPLVLVTHQVNITALTGVYPSSGEIVVIKKDQSELEVIGTIPTR